MTFLNRLSIKSRVILLAFIPLLIIAGFSAYEINKLNQKLSQMGILSDKVDTLNITSNYGSSIHTIETRALDQLSNKQVLEIDIEPFQQSFIELNQQLVRLAADQSSISAIDEMESALDEVSLLESLDELKEWVGWHSELISQLYTAVDKKQTATGVITLEGHYLALSQLHWITSWAREENWLIHYQLKNNGTLEEDEINQQLFILFQRQQYLIEKFLTLNADPMQVDLLLQTFNTPSFINSLVFRDQVIAEEVLSEDVINNGLVALDQRLNLIRTATDKINLQLQSEMSKEISVAHQYRTLFITIIAAIFIILLVLSFNIVHRIITFLTDILSTFKLIEEKHDYSIKVETSGHDEFTEFGVKVNSLISEREVSESNMISAKEEAEKANVAKSTFLANMSHEIRTPLNGIIGMSGILADSKLSPVQKDYLSTIETSSQTLLILINDILDISKIESGNLLLSIHNTNVREIIYDTIAIVLAKAVEKNIDIQVYISPNTPMTVKLDDHRLRQILMNLMSNAVKFTEQGHVKLSLISTHIGENKYSLEFRVEDSGIGIDEAKQQSIFNPFTQEDGSITRQFGGTGLGLAISSQLVKLMDSRIQIDSTKGKGSQFYFTIDVEDKIQPQHLQPEVLDYEVVIIGNQQDFISTITDDLTIFEMNNYSVIDDISTISATNNDKRCYIFCTSENKETVETLNQLRAKITDNPIILLQQYDEEMLKDDSMINGIVSYPLIGNRLINAISSGIKDANDKQEEKRRKLNGEASQVVNENTVIKKNILLVEDNLVNQKVASIFLKKAGFECDIAADGKQGLDMLIENRDKYHVVLMDCMMPVMDGFTSAREFRKYEAEHHLEKTPIIALTASVLDDDIAECFNSGMDDYASKPFNRGLLLDKINNARNV
ncbi:ATP-binding protein [Vibrio sp. SS-MA-C1-2]|uniref:hybrid sensor histidine kinase/response regulator n=1 Tax=Vibrio sp. SS-MA-C1-2 TaxID=2908646 RepID=UPI001F477987|nr:ATP-binding protein [Vibrio sp. SS-MA-C1-2]UJF18144.1 ATP-binding protein [Vibrio sp. SS-MA-C1-2]